MDATSLTSNDYSSSTLIQSISYQSLEMTNYTTEYIDVVTTVTESTLISLELTFQSTHTSLEELSFSSVITGYSTQIDSNIVEIISVSERTIESLSTNIHVFLTSASLVTQTYSSVVRILSTSTVAVTGKIK